MKTLRIITFFTCILLVFNLFAQNEKTNEVKSAIAELLKEKIEIEDIEKQFVDMPKEVLVMDDRIEFRFRNQNSVLYFSDLVNQKIEEPSLGKKSKYILTTEKFNFISSAWHTKYWARLCDLRFELIYFQNQFKKKDYEKQVVLFEQIAMQYRAMPEKPGMSEEQRKYIVQANSQNQQKNYPKAIELYNKVIDVDKTAYPAAYNNLALLFAQTQDYAAAICNMKKYLMLVPETEDARSAQDKIYEWEAELEK